MPLASKLCRTKGLLYSCPSVFALSMSNSLESAPYQLLEFDPYSAPRGTESFREEVASMGGSTGAIVRELTGPSNPGLSPSHGRLMLVRRVWDSSRSRASITSVPAPKLQLAAHQTPIYADGSASARCWGRQEVRNGFCGERAIVSKGQCILRKVNLGAWRRLAQCVGRC